jgi:uncharacterized protein YndB with AHSA1/START domain
MAGKNDDAGTADREIAATRIFDAPRAFVWKAWTDTEHVAQWWGPNGFTNTIHEMNVSPGGIWRFMMHGPDGTDYPNKIVFIEVVEPERLVYMHGDEGDPDQFHVTVTFAAQGGKTSLTMRSVFRTAAERDYVVEKFGAIDGMNQTLSRLTEHLKTMPAEGDFVLTRVFDAPRELVWQAWTEAERLAQWWGPKIFTNAVVTFDFKPGGVFHYSMTKPDGDKMWGRFVYREIVPPTRLVFINAFADEKGELALNPWIADWPLEILNTLTLTEEGGKTRLTLRGTPLNATEEQRKAFVAMQPSMRQGFGGTFDQLDAYLAKA